MAFNLFPNILSIRSTQPHTARHTKKKNIVVYRTQRRHDGITTEEGYRCDRGGRGRGYYKYIKRNEELCYIFLY